MKGGHGVHRRLGLLECCPYDPAGHTERKKNLSVPNDAIHKVVNHQHNIIIMVFYSLDLEAYVFHDLIDIIVRTI